MRFGGNLLTGMCIHQRHCAVSDLGLFYHFVLFNRNLSTRLSVSKMSVQNFLFFDDLILCDKSVLGLYCQPNGGSSSLCSHAFEVSLKLAAFELFLSIVMCLTARVTGQTL